MATKSCANKCTHRLLTARIRAHTCVHLDAATGRGFAEGDVCTEFQPFGRVRLNSHHGHGRFGFYVLGPNFPRRLQQTVSMDGRTNLSTCVGFHGDGSDAGLAFQVSQNVDFDNVFVGQCKSIRFRPLGCVQQHDAIAYWLVTPCAHCRFCETQMMWATCSTAIMWQCPT